MTPEQADDIEQLRKLIKKFKLKHLDGPTDEFMYDLSALFHGILSILEDVQS